MSKEKFEELAFGVCNFANAVEAAAVDLRRHIEGMGPRPTVKEEIFTNLVGWTQRSGNRLRTFWVTSARANNDSDAFKHALSILEDKKASIGSRYHGPGYVYSYWLYKDQIYRQKLSEKKAPVEKPQATDVEAIKQLFPENIAVMLKFERQVDKVIVTPRQYLGSESFSKIASIVRQSGGQYISAGKNSYFQIPIKP